MLLCLNEAIMDRKYGEYSKVHTAKFTKIYGNDSRN
jgi:hypothetical protein